MRAALLFAGAILLAPWLYARWAEPIVYMDNWPDGSPKKRAVSVRTIHGDYVFDGPARAFHAGGQIESDGAYRHGREQGPWRWYRADGSLLAECEFRSGSGEYRSYHSDGSLWWEGRNEAGKRTGNWIARDEAGRKIRDGAYLADQPHGEWQYWSYDDSTLHYSGRWEHGTLVEDDGAIANGVSLRLGWPDHLLEFSLWLFWVLAPWPLALLCAGRGRGLGETLLAVLVVGLCLQSFVLQLLLALGLFHAVPLLTCGAAMLVLGVWRLRADAELRTQCRLWFDSIKALRVGGALLLSAAVIVVVTRLWTSLVEAPSNFDALAYHLPIIADWVRGHGLTHRAEFGQVAFYAFGWEAHGAASMLLLHDDALIALPNLVAWCILLLASFGLSRRLGASRELSVAASLLMLTSPEILRRIAAIQPDLAVAALALAALFFAGFPRREIRGWPLPLLASCGLLLAVKMSAWAYFLGGAALLLAWRRPSWPPHPARPRDLPSLLLPPVALFVGLFWYAHNMLTTANPLGSLKVAVGPWTLFAGELTAAEAYRGSLARLFEFGNGAHLSILASALHASFGPAWWIGVGAALFTVADAGRKSGFARRPVLLWSLAAWLLAFAIYWNTPYSADNGASDYRLTAWMTTNTRFAFLAVALLAPFVAHALTSFGRWGSRLAITAIFLSSGWGVIEIIAPRYEILVAATVLALLSCWTSQRSLRLAPLLGASIVLLFAVYSHDGRLRRHDSRLQLYGSAYEYVLRYLPPEQRLGYAMTQRRYPFVGPRLTHEVRSAVPIVGGRDRWFAQLERDGIDVLLIGHGSSGESGRVNPEDVRPWLQDETSPFELKAGFQSQRRDIEVWQRR